MTDTVPDYIEPLEGWRAWRVGRDGEGAPYRLQSLVQRAAWPARQELVAECLRGRTLFARLRGRRRHGAPQPDCECGIYATTSLEQLLTVYAFTLAALFSQQPWQRASYVFGRVALWGSVIECERGWRAARAYPRQIFIPAARGGGGAPGEGLAGDLADYGVPVQVLSFAGGDPLEMLGFWRGRLGSTG